MNDGFIITEGIACAKAVIFRNEQLQISQTHIDESMVEHEINLYLEAVDRTHQMLQNELIASHSQSAKEFLEISILYLIDPTIKDSITCQIKHDHHNAEFAIVNSYHTYIDNLLETNDPFVLHNQFELHNLAETLVLELHKKKVTLPNITSDCILVCNNITPAQFLSLNTEHIKGCLLEDGNTNSHLAIILGATKIPTIFNVKNATSVIKNDQEILIDAFDNHIYLEPEEEILWLVKDRAKKQHSIADQITPMIAQYMLSPTGKQMSLLANVGSQLELKKLVKLPSSGIGLFRTELLFLNSATEPTEDEQYAIYKQIMSSLPPKYEVTFRTFDFTADKLPLYMTNQSAITVSSLGSASSSNTKKLLVKQLRALLRASRFGNMRIMFPMITDYEEVNELMDLVKNIKINLKNEGYTINDVAIGIMIETPSGAIMAKDLAPLVDFISIGTNDLTQYTEACSREVASKRNDELTPAVLKLLYHITKETKEFNKPISICGELVHNLDYLAIFIAIGLCNFSVGPFYLVKLLDFLNNTKVIIPSDLDEKIKRIKTKKEIIELNNSLIANTKS